MGKIFDIALLLFCLGLLAIDFKNSEDFRKLEGNMIAEGKIKDRRIEELEKEVRLLKTDMRIMEYGFEGGKENGKD